MPLSGAGDFANVGERMRSAELLDELTGEPIYRALVERYDRE
jgi:hypothetical protein